MKRVTHQLGWGVVWNNTQCQVQLDRASLFSDKEVMVLFSARDQLDSELESSGISYSFTQSNKLRHGFKNKTVEYNMYYNKLFELLT